MNKLVKNSLYGMFPEWDDWNWLQNSTRDTFRDFLKAWGVDDDEMFRLWGAETTYDPVDDEHDTTEGAVVLNGEICYVPAHSVANNSAPDTDFQFQVQSSFDPSGNEVTEDGPNTDCYEIREAKLVFGPTQDGGGNPIPYLGRNGVTLKQIITEQVLERIPSNHGASFGGSLVNGWLNGAQDVKYRKDAFGYLELQGIADGNAATGAVIFNLPNTGYRPNEAVWATVRMSDETLHAMKIDTNGDVSLQTFGAAANVYNLNGVRVRLSY